VLVPMGIRLEESQRSGTTNRFSATSIDSSPASAGRILLRTLKASTAMVWPDSCAAPKPFSFTGCLSR